MKIEKNNSAGFTIIELLMATIVFSMVMTVILVSAFQIGRIYYKGVSLSSTNEATRLAIEDISNDVRLAHDASCASTGTQNCNYGNNIRYFCVGLHRYTYVMFKKVTNDDLDNAAQNPNNTQYLTGIRQDQVTSGCPSPDTAGTNPVQLLGPDMQLNSLTFACANGACTIGAHVIFYGADDTVFRSSAHPNDPTAALKDPDASCSGNLLSSQFCAAVDLQTKILQRS